MALPGLSRAIFTIRSSFVEMLFELFELAVSAI